MHALYRGNEALLVENTAVFLLFFLKKNELNIHKKENIIFVKN